MAGMYTPFHQDALDWLKFRVGQDFHLACIQIDGLMGIIYPGHSWAWIDYDD